MDYCNKDKALKVKEVAERKFKEKDYVGAKKFALKAKDLFPELDFISLFITVINIYQKLGNGEPDWYGVLGLEKPATIAKISANHSILYRDVKAGRNDVIGAEEALQIISEAFCILTDSFWTKCSSCQFRFQYLIDFMNKELVCIKCHGRFIAVPLYCGNHPTNPLTINNFPGRETSVAGSKHKNMKKKDEERGRRSKHKNMNKEDDGGSRVMSMSAVLALPATSSSKPARGRGRSKTQQ